jgi:hypothetical protein
MYKRIFIILALEVVVNLLVMSSNIKPQPAFDDQLVLSNKLLNPAIIQSFQTTPTMTADACYSQCISSELFWYDTFELWGTFAYFCSPTVMDIKDIFGPVITISAASGVMTYATLIGKVVGCYYLVSNMDFLFNGCHNTCAENVYSYAPNLTANTHYYPGVYYRESAQKLRVNVPNAGGSVANSSSILVRWGHTANSDRKIDHYDILLDGHAPELSPWMNLREGVTICRILGNSKKYCDALALIDVQNTKAPPFLYQTDLDWQPIADEYNEVTISLDSENEVLESFERDNDYTLVIDLIPAPAQYIVESATYELVPGSLSDFLITLVIKNRGEVEGRVHVDTFEGLPTQNPVEQQSISEILPGGETFTQAFHVSVDIQLGDSFWMETQGFTFRLSDDGGKIHQDYPVGLPILAAEISGCVDDEEGNPVANATIEAAGVSVTSSIYGCYSMKIGTLGSIPITASHPDFRTADIKTIPLPDTADAQADLGALAAALTIEDFDFVLRDPVDKRGTLNLYLMTSGGYMPAGSYDAFNDKGEHVTGVVEGGKPTEIKLKAGLWRVVGFSSGFQSPISGWIVITEFGQSDLFLTLQQIIYKRNDGGLQITAPSKLWTKTITGGIMDAVVSKDGQLVVVLTYDGGDVDSATLHFIDGLTGNLRRSVPLPWFDLRGPGTNERLDVTYNGSSDPGAFSQVVVGLYALSGERVGDPPESDPSGVYFFNAWGDPLIQLTDKSVLGITRTNDVYFVPFLEISPDRTLVYFTTGLYMLTTGFSPQLIPVLEAEPGYDIHPRMLGLMGSFTQFDFDNNVNAQCPDDNSIVCKFDLQKNIIHPYQGALGGNMLVMDASGGTRVAAADIEGLNLYDGGNLLWHKSRLEVCGYEEQYMPRLSITPGGSTVMALCGSYDIPGSVFIINQSGQNVTPEGVTTANDIYAVSANAKGLFYLKGGQWNQMSYYQVGTMP